VAEKKTTLGGFFQKLQNPSHAFSWTVKPASTWVLKPYFVLPVFFPQVDCEGKEMFFQSQWANGGFRPNQGIPKSSLIIHFKSL